MPVVALESGQETETYIRIQQTCGHVVASRGKLGKRHHLFPQVGICVNLSSIYTENEERNLGIKEQNPSKCCFPLWRGIKGEELVTI